ncbi:hypothetical protein GPJ56_003223 [Histomonas meleagridis]|uniref:uncharacterized protein n=1 Tax=Histomonas meleagridis TaxID=135588 RepID=UPI00355A5A32|nr:hypothetical protein GPJ56_003223 [Histomonas meleagridis]KAH0803144.1 hypothetical protein GO595_004057 [Histomonas meleagridis]
MNLYAVLEDYTTVSHYSLPFLNDYSVIHSISSSLSEYWNHHQIINNSKALIHESWKRIWDESKQFSNFKDQIVKSFLTGTTPPTISTEVHRSRVHKSIIHEFDQIQSIIADQIIPSFLSMDKASNSLFETLEFLPALGITLDSIDSSTQIKKCVSILKSIRKLKNCFDALFCYLDSPQTVLTDLEKLSVPNAQFADFLINYFQMFDMLEFSTGEGPICKPVYNAIQERNIELTGVISSMRCGKCCCIAETILVYSLRENKITELIVEGRPLAAYAFDDESIGCFYNNDGKIMFKMIGEEEQEPNEVSLIGASVFVFSPRKIALVSSDELFCSVVDLESCAGEEEEIEEDE